MQRIPMTVISPHRGRGSYMIEVRPTATILKVKHATLEVFKDHDVHDEDVLSERVFYKGKELEDEKTLLDYGITETESDEDLHLVPVSQHPVPKIPKEIPIRVYSASSGSTIIHVRPTATIKSVKHLAFHNFGDSAHLFEPMVMVMVYHKGKFLEDNRTLYDYGITQPYINLFFKSKSLSYA